jgi:hypothetical protein
MPALQFSAFQIRSRHVWCSGVRGGKVRPEEASLSGCLSTSAGTKSIAGFVSIGCKVTEWAELLVSSATEAWRVKAIERQQSGKEEGLGSDLLLGAGQQSWLARGWAKQSSRQPDVWSNMTRSKMNVKRLKS